MKIETVKIAIKRADPNVPVAVMDFITVGRGSILPFGGKWIDKTSGWWTREPTDENIRHQIMRAKPHLGEVESYRIIDAKDIPCDRSFRDAWEDKDMKIVHNMEKARNIHRNNLRDLRAPLLEALDTEYMRADEQGDIKVKTEIAKKKQELRDATDYPAIDAAKNIGELKKAVPKCLNP